MILYFGNRFIQLADEGTCIPGSYPAPRIRGEIRMLIFDFLHDETVPKLSLITSDLPLLKRTIQSFFVLVPAAGGIVQNEKGELLCIFRRGKWDLPKGKVNPEPWDWKSSVSKAVRSNYGFLGHEAIREVKEETGLRDVHITGRLKPTYHIYLQEQTWCLKKTAWFRMTAPEDQPLTPQVEEDIEKVRWIRSDELSMVLENTYASLKKTILDAMHAGY